MKMEGLSFDNVPAIHIPFRFFNTAPWMGLFAAVILFFSGAEAFDSQWTPQLLAITHLLTLGFMVMVMFGALFQLLPVISGITIPKARVIAPLIHIALVLGVALLVVGFLRFQYHLFFYALPLLVAAFVFFLVALGSRLRHNIRGGDSIYVIRFAALSLMVTIVLGVVRVLTYLGYNDFFVIQSITNLHLGWGLAGWSLLVVMGVSYQVIPMFHITPCYSKKITKTVPALLFFCLLGLSFIQGEVLSKMLIIIICLVMAFYATYSLFLLSKRKRKIRDLTVYFWRLAFICLGGGAFLLAINQFFELSGRFNTTLGVLAIYGFFISVIMGMLLKIIPFLTYLHLQRQCMTRYELLPSLPNMREIISENQAVWQFRLHVISLLLLLFCTVFSQAASIAGLAMLLDFMWLGISVTKASKLYYQHSRRIINTAPVVCDS